MDQMGIFRCPILMFSNLHAHEESHVIKVLKCSLVLWEGIFSSHCTGHCQAAQEAQVVSIAGGNIVGAEVSPLLTLHQPQHLRDQEVWNRQIWVRSRSTKGPDSLISIYLDIFVHALTHEHRCSGNPSVPGTWAPRPCTQQLTNCLSEQAVRRTEHVGVHCVLGAIHASMLVGVNHEGATIHQVLPVRGRQACHILMYRRLQPITPVVVVVVVVVSDSFQQPRLISACILHHVGCSMGWTREDYPLVVF